MASSSASSNNRSSVLLSASEQDFIRQGVLADCRADGRTAAEFRTYSIQVGDILKLSHGSARLLSSSDDEIQMLCSVKAELVTPSRYYPDHGVIEVSIDQHNSNYAKTSSKNVAIREAEAALSRIQWIDTTKLCVVPGAASWRLSVDLYCLGVHFSLDAASHCIRHALANTLLPSIDTSSTITQKQQQQREGGSSANVLDHLIVNSDIANAIPVVETVDHIPILITTTVIACGNRHILLQDADINEEACSAAAVHVAVVNGNVMAVWKSGSGSLPATLLPSCVNAAMDAADMVDKHYKKTVGKSSQMLLLQEPLVIK